MDDGEAGPPLKGADFRVKWGLKSAEALFAVMSARMPPARPGTLGDQAYVELIALMLRENGVEGGSKELSSDAEVLKTVCCPLATARGRRARTRSGRPARSHSGSIRWTSSAPLRMPC